MAAFTSCPDPTDKRLSHGWFCCEGVGKRIKNTKRNSRRCYCEDAVKSLLIKIMFLDKLSRTDVRHFIIYPFLSPAFSCH